jgi:plasmid stabilization system protein ParE
MILLSSAATEDVERLRTLLDQSNPDAAQRALALIWTAIERLQDFPALGGPTEDVEIRQIVVRFVAPGYIVRYAKVPETHARGAGRHGREARI